MCTQYNLWDGGLDLATQLGSAVELPCAGIDTGRGPRNPNTPQRRRENHACLHARLRDCCGGVGSRGGEDAMTIATVNARHTGYFQTALARWREKNPEFNDIPFRDFPDRIADDVLLAAHIIQVVAEG